MSEMIKALEKSIEHWKEYVFDGKRLKNCPLCTLYHNSAEQRDVCDTCSVLQCSCCWGRQGCWRCPIYQVTKQPGCEGTPFIVLKRWVNNFHMPSDLKKYRKGFYQRKENLKQGAQMRRLIRASAKGELRFLENLLRTIKRRRSV